MISPLLVSAVLIFMGSNMTFGLFSLVPVALTGVIIIYQGRKNGI